MAQKTEKTNVMRVLDAKKVKYESHCYLDIHRTSFKTVSARGTRHGRYFIQYVGDVHYFFKFFLCKLLLRIHKRKIIRHLAQIGHSAQYGDNAVER